MGQQTSMQLVDDLNNSDKEIRKLTRVFAEVASHKSVQLPICCFYETKKTEMLRRFVSPSLATKLSATINHKTQKIVRCLCQTPIYIKADMEKLVTEDSACLDTFKRIGLDTTHSGMNKFDGPENSNFKQVKDAIKHLVANASAVLVHRKSCKLIISDELASASRTSLSNLTTCSLPGVSVDCTVRT